MHPSAHGLANLYPLWMTGAAVQLAYASAINDWNTV